MKRLQLKNYWSYIKANSPMYPAAVAFCAALVIAAASVDSGAYAWIFAIPLLCAVVFGYIDAQR